MAPNIIEKYERILAADPRSRIFVELARALLDRGDPRRAIEVCRAGLEFHPKSILGRVIWGRALLEAADLKGAQDQFEVAIGIDPGTPYAYNLVGEALVAAGRHREALPVLARAADLQPADAQARARLDEARRKAGGGTAVAMPAAAAPRPGTTSPEAKAGPTRAAMAAATAPPATGSGPEEPAAPVPVAASTPADAASAPSSAPAAPAAHLPADDAPTDEMTLRLVFNDQPATGQRPPGPPPVPVRKSGGLPGPRTLLGILPEDQPAAARPAPTSGVHDPAEASRLAHDYERELRERAAHAEAQDAAPTRRGRVMALVALAVVVAGAGGTFAWFRSKAQSEELERSLRDARVGLARDTRGALAKAAEVLARARSGASGDPRLLSLVAQVNAVLAADHGDAAARALALELADPAVAGDGALAVRWLLAISAAEKEKAGEALVSTPAGATLEPIVHRLAGAVLIARGQHESGRARLEKAAGAAPPDLAALAMLGDSLLEGHDPERALAWFEAAIGAHATHPRSVMGAAEARLALARPLDGSLKELAAVEADKASPPPVPARLRFELVQARVLAATGDVAGAVRRLTLAAGALGGSARLEATRAGLLADARRWDEAEVAAQKALRLEPKSAEHRLRVAHVRNGGHRHAAALQVLEGLDGRPAWLERGIALHGLGRQEQARAALERTIRDGRMPADAAVWYARADVALGRADRAVELLSKLAAARGAGALVQATLGEALLAARRPAEAEAACYQAISRDARAPEGHRCLGQVLLGGGHPAVAVAPLEQAVVLDPADPEARKLLASAKAPPPAPKAAPAPRKAPARKKK